MGETVIKVENLSKKFIIGHQRSERYTALRDVMVNNVKGAFRKTRELIKGNTIVEGVSEDFWALKDVNFEVKQGDRVGIIGRNGAGKSTLLKILSRITEPTNGRITLNGRVASLLEVGTGFHPELTGRENIFLNGAILGMTRAEIRRKFDEIVEFAEVEKFLDTPVKRYSSGMYVRLAFSVAAHLEPEILVVDEVLAVGDAQFQKKCLGKMEDVSNNEGRTVLFVSHNMSAINDLCNKGIYLVNGTNNGIDYITNIISNYVSQGQNNIAYFNDHLEYVKVSQISETIQIEASYNTNRPLDVPHLGFIIKDSMGVPIFGSNPSIDLIEFNSKIYEKKGLINVTIMQPKLMDGNYIVSVWFGDGVEEFLVAHDCINFNVVGMTTQKQNLSSKIGNVLPVCSWAFS